MSRSSRRYARRQQRHDPFDGRRRVPTTVDGMILLLEEHGYAVQVVEGGYQLSHADGVERLIEIVPTNCTTTLLTVLIGLATDHSSYIYDLDRLVGEAGAMEREEEQRIKALEQRLATELAGGAA